MMNYQLLIWHCLAGTYRTWYLLGDIIKEWVGLQDKYAGKKQQAIEVAN